MNNSGKINTNPMGLFDWFFEQLILARKAKAIKKGITAKVARISELLGVKNEKPGPGSISDGVTEYLYSDSVMRVYYKMVFWDAGICYVWEINLINTQGGSSVFDAIQTPGSYSPTIRGYAPGSWETHFHSLSKRSLSVQAERETKAAEAARKAKKDKRKRFGL